MTSYAIGLLLIPLTDAFGWSRQDILTAQSFVTGVTLFTSVFVGALTDRVSVRKLIIGSQIAFGLAFFVLAAFIQKSLIVFYALYIFLAIVAAGTLPMTFNRLISRHFHRRRGLAIGIALTGSGFCGLLVPPLIVSVIQHYGWRAGYIALGVIPIAVACGASFWLIPKTEAPPPARRHGEPGLLHTPDVAVRAALRDRRFWTMALAFFLGAGVTNGLVANIVPLLQGSGLTPLRAASALSAFGIAVIAGRIAVGFLVDHVWGPPVALAVMLPAAAATVLLAQGHMPLSEAYIIAVVLGLAAGAEADMLSYLTGRYFGLKHIGQLYAILFVFFSAGIGVAVPLFGRVFDLYQSYDIALYGGAAGWVVCGLLLMTLGPYPERVGSEVAINAA